MKQTAENKVKAGAAGGIETVMKVINTNICNPNVCEQGCRALWDMTFNNCKSTGKTQQHNTNEMNS